MGTAQTQALEGSKNGGALRHITQRVQVPNNWVLGIWVIVITLLALGKYMIIRYLDP